MDLVGKAIRVYKKDGVCKTGILKEINQIYLVLQKNNGTTEVIPLIEVSRMELDRVV